MKKKMGKEHIVDSFTTIEGVKYRENCNLRFMLVGWAPNGWDEKRLYDDSISRGSFIHSSILNFTNDVQVINNVSKGRFEWIDDGDEWGHCPHNCFREGIDSSREIIEEHPYHLSAQIWNYPKEVWCKLAQEVNHPNRSSKDAWRNRWYDNIVWTDLYKLYPVAGSNPPEWWKKIQFEACADLLIEEIRYFEPTHILFATDAEWFIPFYDYCFSSCVFEVKGNKYIKYQGRYNDAKIIVTCRPDNRKAGYTKNEYTDASFIAFSEV